MLQILGFDVLLLDDGKPMLLEVNSNPSLRIDYEREVVPGIYECIYSQVDAEIKKPLVHDTLLLVTEGPDTMRWVNYIGRGWGGGEHDISIFVVEEY